MILKWSPTKHWDFLKLNNQKGSSYVPTGLLNPLRGSTLSVAVCSTLCFPASERELRYIGTSRVLLETKTSRPRDSRLQFSTLRQDPGIWICMKYFGWFPKRQGMCRALRNPVMDRLLKNGQLYFGQLIYRICPQHTPSASDGNISIYTHECPPVNFPDLGPSHFSHQLKGSFLELIGQQGGRVQMAAWYNCHPLFPLSTSEQV